MAGFYDARTFDPQEGLGFLVGHVRSRLLEALENELAPLELSALQAVVIVKTALGEESHAAAFCRDLRYDPGAMTRLLDRLEKRGLLRRVRSPRDRRAIHLELTEKGRAALPRIRAAAVTVFNRFLRGFSRAEAEQLVGYLRRLLANAGP
jgi:MarR family transcriptional regulator, multiple antibiotic resistance protein MarR